MPVPRGASSISPRPAFSLTVTIAVEPFDVVEELTEVRALQLQGTALDDPVLTGRVLDGDLGPVPDATVTLTDGDGHVVATRTSDRWGAFAFRDVGFAAYALTVHATGHPDETRAVTYARQSQVHNVVLPAP